MTLPMRTPCMRYAIGQAANSNALSSISECAHALSRLSNSVYAIGAGCFYSEAEHDASSELTALARAQRASSCVVAGNRNMGGGLPLDWQRSHTGMHRLARLSSK